MEKMLNDLQAAELLNLKPQTLRNWRSARKGPSYLRLGRAVRYRPEDLIEYLKSRRITVEH